MQPCKTDVVVK